MCVWGNEVDVDLTNSSATAVTTITDALLCNGVPATIVGTSGNDILNGTKGDDLYSGNGRLYMLNGECQKVRPGVEWPTI